MEHFDGVAWMGITPNEIFAEICTQPVGIFTNDAWDRPKSFYKYDLTGSSCYKGLVRMCTAWKMAVIKSNIMN